MTRSLTWPTLVGAVGLLIAAFLFVYYVNVVQDAVTRGSQFKYAQQEARPSAAKGGVVEISASTR